MKNALLLLLSLMIFSSCRKEIIVPEDSFRDLFGEWRWIESSGGLGGGGMTPASAGYNLTLEYTDDGVFRLFKDGKKELQFFYKFVEGDPIRSSGADWMIQYKESRKGKSIGIHQSFTISGNELTLYDECFDCYVSRYIRD